MRQAGFLVLLMIAPMCATAAPRGPARSADEGTLVRALAGDARLVTLKNGMQILLAPDSTTAAVDVSVWYRAGIAHERPGITGISRLFEHLMFRGSAHYAFQEHSRLVAAEGGSANAYTAPDYVCYYETVPASALELTFRLEADRMASPALTAEGVEAEKRVALEENRWRRGADPTAAALRGLDSLAWAGEPYGWPVTGLDQDLSRITLADCQRFFAERFAPNNALVVVAGDFDPDRALQEARRSFEALRRRPLAKDSPPVVAARGGERRAFARADQPLPILAVGWKIPGRRDPDAPALALLARVLAAGPSARLSRALASGRARCLGVQAGVDDRRDSGLLYVTATVWPGSDSAKVESTLVAEVERLARVPVSEEELQRARRQAEVGTLLAWETPRGRAEALGQGLLLEDDYRASASRLERTRQLTPADVQRAAARVLVAAGRSVLWIAPANPPAIPGSGGAGAGGETPGLEQSPAEGGR